MVKMDGWHGGSARAARENTSRARAAAIFAVPVGDLRAFLEALFVRASRQ